MFNYKLNNQILLNFIILIFLFKFVKTDICTIKAICECQYVNKSSNTFNENSSNTNLLDDKLNLCLPKNNTAVFTNKFALNCTYIDFKANTTEFKPPAPIPQDSFTLDLQYPCPIKPPTESHYSTGTILIIIFFTCILSYLGLGIAVNYFLVGARGIEMLPNLDFWKDFPALVLDGVKFIQNGCKARPSDLTSPTGQEGYDAI